MASLRGEGKLNMGAEQSQQKEETKSYHFWDGSEKRKLRLDLAIYGAFEGQQDATADVFYIHVKERDFYCQQGQVVLAWRRCMYSGAILMEGPTDNLPYDPQLPVVLALANVNPTKLADVTPFIRNSIMRGEREMPVRNETFSSVDPAFGVRKALLLVGTPQGSPRQVVLGPIHEREMLDLSTFPLEALLGSFGNELAKAAIVRGRATAELQRALTEEGEARVALERELSSYAVYPTLLSLGLLAVDQEKLQEAREALQGKPGGEAWLDSLTAALAQRGCMGEAGSAAAAADAGGGGGGGAGGAPPPPPPPSLCKARARSARAREARAQAEAALEKILAAEWSYSAKVQGGAGGGVGGGSSSSSSSSSSGGEEELEGGIADAEFVPLSWRNLGSASGALVGGGSGRAAPASPPPPSSSLPTPSAQVTGGSGVGGGGGGAAAAAGDEAPPTAAAAGAVEVEVEEDNEIHKWLSQAPGPHPSPVTLGSAPHTALPLAVADTLGLKLKIANLGFPLAGMINSAVGDINHLVAGLIGGLKLETSVAVNKFGRPLKVQLKVAERAPLIEFPLQRDSKLQRDS